MRRGIGSIARSPSYQFVPGRSIVERGSSKCAIPPRRETGWWPCSSVSTCHEGNLQGGCTRDTGRESSSNRVSSMSRHCCRRSLVRSSCASHGWSRLSSRQRETRHAMLFRRVYAMNPAATRTNGAHSVVGFFLCRSLHREGNRPASPCQQHSRTQVGQRTLIAE